MRLLPAALILAAALPASAARSDDRPLDTRLYIEGVESIRKGNRVEGAKLLRRVFTEFPDSRHAAAALLRVADLIYPVRDWNGVGSASAAAVRKAAPLLERLADRYRSSREAPRALVRLGYLALEPANPAAGLEAACARFSDSARLYPDSDVAADASCGPAWCAALRARPERAADFFSRLLDEHPGSPLAAEALYRKGMALSRLDDPAEAMLTLQRLRATHPGSEPAARALDAITLIHRMRILPSLRRAAAGSRAPDGADGTRLFRYDAEYGAAVSSGDNGARRIRGSSDIVIDPHGRAVVASRRSPGVFRLDRRGAIRDRIDHPGPEFLAVGKGPAVYISGRRQIAVNTTNWSGAELKGSGGRSVGDFGPIALDPSGRVYLLDTSENAVLVYDQRRRLVGTLRPPPGRGGRFVDLAMGEDGAVYVLGARPATVAALHQGRPTSHVSLAVLGLAAPAALAVDALGDLFILDGKTGWVFVADPGGRRLAVVRPPEEATRRLGRASALAVDGRGRIYLCGRKTGQVVRFR
ncbi:MAG: tetratricopeptide repeat protein [Gemmatimonadota bacterium]